MNPDGFLVGADGRPLRLYRGAAPGEDDIGGRDPVSPLSWRTSRRQDVLDPIDRHMIDPSLMPILTARVGAAAAANLLDDLAHGVIGADRRLAAVLGTGIEYGQPRFFRMADVELPQGHKVLDYTATIGPGIGWNGRHLIVRGSFPETMTMALIGGPLGAVVGHPQIDPGMTISSVLRDSDKTRFCVSIDDCRPITVREALGDEAARLTDRARRKRTLRRRIMLARIWRTPISSVAEITMAAMLAMAIGSATGFLFQALDARIAVTVMCLVPAMALAPLVKDGLMLDENREITMHGHYDQLAFDTKEQMEDERDAKAHFAALARLL